MVFESSGPLIHVERLDTSTAKRILLGGIDDSELDGEVILMTDGHSWLKHLQTFYSWPQYGGSLIILVGVSISMFPSYSSDLFSIWSWVFVAFSVPSALSSVYKQVAFWKVKEMDVWYFSTFIALPQVIFGLFSVLFAANLVGLEIYQIPENFWRSILCLYGYNSLSRATGDDCSVDKNCVDEIFKCCDSCDASIPSLSYWNAGVILLIYTVFNIAYNAILLLLVKHESALYMQIAMLLVLPVGGFFFHNSGHHGKSCRTFYALHWFEHGSCVYWNYLVQGWRLYMEKMEGRKVQVENY
eukprot:TRINITY_DN11879_c0_g1_i1.p1 TRINITY_DN11879_c0_g1~~TRINITY_DN11879_c0_g1_i1.p1  ORF type:complete len:319 (+),score=37.54 TRINITY_DN11879_c0_g1_i1:63-959(+)